MALPLFAMELKNIYIYINYDDSVFTLAASGEPTVNEVGSMKYSVLSNTSIIKIASWNSHLEKCGMNMNGI